MKKFTFIYILILVIAGGVLLFNYQKRACAGSKCYYRMVCQGNSNIQAHVCTYDCNDSETKKKVIEAFKKKCSQPGNPTSPKWGWDNCDITLK